MQDTKAENHVGFLLLVYSIACPLLVADDLKIKGKKVRFNPEHSAQNRKKKRLLPAALHFSTL